MLNRPDPMSLQAALSRMVHNPPSRARNERDSSMAKSRKSASQELFIAEQLEDSKRIIRQAGIVLSGAAEKIWPLMEITPISTSIKEKQ